MEEDHFAAVVPNVGTVNVRRTGLGAFEEVGVVADLAERVGGWVGGLVG